MSEIARTFTKAALSRISAGTQGAKLIGATLAGYSGLNVQDLLDELKTAVASKVSTSDARLSDARTPVQATETVVGGGEVATTTEARTGTDDQRIMTPLKAIQLRSLGAFRASKSANQTGIVTSTNTKITYDTEELDASGWYDPTTSRFTPLRAGWYRIRAQARIASSVDATKIEMFVYKNGTFSSELGRFTLMPSATAQLASGVVDTLVSFNGTTDFVEIGIFQTSGANAQVNLGTSHTFIEGYFHSS